MTILFEDNHLLIVSKQPGEITQGDKTGDTTLLDTAKAYIKEKYHKPGEVFLGLPHRLDRPTSGIVVLCRTSKALTRMSALFREGKVSKTYHAIVPRIHTTDNQWHQLTHYLIRNEKQNKSYAYPTQRQGSKQAQLKYHIISHNDRYTLLEIQLLTGRHHQIRSQLAAMGLTIRGDLKYGAPRSNPDGSICLHARTISFTHPVTQQPISLTAPYPTLPLWHTFK